MADAKLPVATGLQLWLDAPHANGGQPANGKLDRWLDASGHGLTGQGGPSATAVGYLTLTMNKAAMHPVLHNFDRLALTDELPADRVMATEVEEKEPRPQPWSLERGRGWVFVSIPGHCSHTFDDPMFRVPQFRGIAWSAKEPVDRFDELVWPGGDVAKRKHVSGTRSASSPR